MEVKAKRTNKVEKTKRTGSNLTRSQKSLTRNPSLNSEPKKSVLSKANFTNATQKNLSELGLFDKLRRDSSSNFSPVYSNISPKLSVTKSGHEFPLHPKAALSIFTEKLNKLEQSEILEYQLIYYLGSENRIKPTMEGHNNGYDDDKGDYKVIIGDHIAYRYEILKVLGKGSFGTVLECVDYKRSEKVAVKVIKNKSRFHQQAQIEIKILQRLRENDRDGKYNTVKVKNYFIFRKHICISFELLNISLFDLLRQNKFSGFSMALIHRFTIQLLVCLQYLSRHKIIHCDLKPENILLKDTEKALINVIDFGSSCFENERVYYYIQSRYYRAPEIILGIPYSSAIDMWSFGCIAAELFTGRALFPGESEHIQLIYMMQLLGVPPGHVVLKSSYREKYFEENLSPKIIENKKGIKKTPGSSSLSSVLAGCPEGFIDLVSKCLTWDPLERISPNKALTHPWIMEGLKKIKQC